MDKVSRVHAPNVGGTPTRRPANEYALLPAEAPLPMPRQSLRPEATGNVVRDRLSAPRAILILLTVSATATFAFVLYQVLSVVHLTPLQAVFLVLCTLCFAWIALGTASALLGFFASLRWEAGGLWRTPVERGLQQHRTALLFPVYQEDAARVAATIEAMATELIALAERAGFDFFVLSDSRTPEAKARELRAVRLLRRALPRDVHVYYRARSENIGKKAGNIADWVERFGSAYEFFIILDADSVMSGALVVQLAELMGRNPRAALIQTVPRLVGADTLFARLQQFAVAFYGPVIAAGFAAWHQESGNYWGHNAILRTRAFAQSAGLPTLAGTPPLGGHIQSHDFVEAAFLRRAGWQVWMLPYLQGSYEGCPPTLIDVAVRDRRWAQGNFQHLRIVRANGLPWVSRLHLAMGTYSYVASALWALSLVVGVVLAFQSAYTLPVYFQNEKSLFPVWPVIDPTKALYLFLGTLAVVLLPKVLGILSALIRRDAAARSPGRFLLGAAIETLFSVLVAPILMLTQTSAVLEILRGKDAGWSVQRRQGEAPPFDEVVRFHKWHVLTGVALAATCSLVSFYVFAWMAPIVLGQLLAVGLSMVTSRPPPSWMNRAMATAEEMQPPPIILAVRERHADWARRLIAKRAWH
jgi:membrane glycosyltransferase